MLDSSLYYREITRYNGVQPFVKRSLVLLPATHQVLQVPPDGTDTTFVGTISRFVDLFRNLFFQLFSNKSRSSSFPLDEDILISCIVFLEKYIVVAR